MCDITWRHVAVRVSLDHDHLVVCPLVCLCPYLSSHVTVVLVDSPHHQSYHVCHQYIDQTLRQGLSISVRRTTVSEVISAVTRVNAVI